MTVLLCCAVILDMSGISKKGVKVSNIDGNNGWDHFNENELKTLFDL